MPSPTSLLYPTKAPVPKIDPYSNVASSPYSANYVYSSAVDHALGLAPPAWLGNGVLEEDALDRQLAALIEAEEGGWDGDGEKQRYDLRRRSRRLRRKSKGEWKDFVQWVKGFVGTGL
jgi:hypothetical protein